MKLSDGLMCFRHLEGTESLIMRIAETQHDNGLAIRSYRLTVANGKGELSAFNEHGELLGMIEIEETEFPLPEITLYCDHEKLMLPSER
jgi:hypothetical protein